MSGQYLYIESESGLSTVGFYDPQGRWIPESDHATPTAAARRVAELNGGNGEQHIRELAARIEQLTETVGRLIDAIREISGRLE